MNDTTSMNDTLPMDSPPVYTEQDLSFSSPKTSRKSNRATCSSTRCTQKSTQKSQIPSSSKSSNTKNSNQSSNSTNKFIPEGFDCDYEDSKSSESEDYECTICLEPFQ